MGFRCIECGFRIGNNKPLFVQYSPGNIRLMKCENCKAVADEYIECEIMILLIDLILHKPKAYRHLLYNLLNRQAGNLQNMLHAALVIPRCWCCWCNGIIQIGLFWKTAFAFLLLETYRVLLDWNEEGWGLSAGFSPLVSKYGKALMDLLFGNFVFLSCLLLMTRYYLEASFGASQYIDVLLAIFISSYFKIFLIVMMVWEFPSPVLFIIDIFVLSSNTVALKVITESSIGKCIGACFSAHAVKLFFRGLLDIAYRDH